MIPRFHDARDRFFEHRFGMFVHWGLYAVPAWHEQIWWRRRMKKKDYLPWLDQFNPSEFDPEAWMKLVKDAGMSYVCITTKHHDGFCLWDTKHTDWKITNTPYKKDLLAQLSKAAEKAGVLLSLYYSCPDWHYKHSINQGGDHELDQQNPGDEPNEDKYIEYVKNQVRELATGYGKIHTFFWDIPPKRKDPSINAMLRELQPGIVINDRGYDKGDFDTPERHVPAGKGFSRPTEACQSVGKESWGYREDEDFFSNALLRESVAKILPMGGNYLLNVGPDALGRIPKEAADAVRAVGTWYKKVKEGLVGENASHVLDHENFLLTHAGNAVYVVFYKNPGSTGLVLNPIDRAPASATLLNDGRALKAAVRTVPSRWKSRPYLHLQGLPVNEITDEPLVVKLAFDKITVADLEAMKAKGDEGEFIY